MTEGSVSSEFASAIRQDTLRRTLARMKLRMAQHLERKLVCMDRIELAGSLIADLCNLCEFFFAVWLPQLSTFNHLSCTLKQTRCLGAGKC